MGNENERLTPEEARIVKEVRRRTQEQLAGDQADVGACCIHNPALKACIDDATENSCREFAREMGMSFEWHKGKKCGDIKCRRG